MIGLTANIWAWGCLAVLSILALLAAPPWLVLGKLRGRAGRTLAREGIWLYGRAYLAFLRPVARIESQGLASARIEGPALLAVNHQSWLDIYLMSAQSARDVCFFIRAWPFRRLFFFRPLMRLAGYIETEESSCPDEIFRRCREELARGAVLVAFPEGTRSRDGVLGRFHSGLFRLAVEVNLPVRPLIINGSGRVMPKGSLCFRPGVIKMEWGAPVRPEDFAGDRLPHRSLRRAAQMVFQKALACDCNAQKD